MGEQHIPSYLFGVAGLAALLLAGAFVSAGDAAAAEATGLVTGGLILVAVATYVWRLQRPDAEWDHLFYWALLLGSYGIFGGLLAAGYVFGSQTLGLAWPLSGLMALLTLVLTYGSVIYWALARDKRRKATADVHTQTAPA